MGSSLLCASTSLVGISTKAEHEIAQNRAFYTVWGPLSPYRVTCVLIGWFKLLGSEAAKGEGGEGRARSAQTLRDTDELARLTSCSFLLLWMGGGAATGDLILARRQVRKWGRTQTILSQGLIGSPYHFRLILAHDLLAWLSPHTPSCNTYITLLCGAAEEGSSKRTGSVPPPPLTF